MKIITIKNINEVNFHKGVISLKNNLPKNPSEYYLYIKDEFKKSKYYIWKGEWIRIKLKEN